MNTVKYVLSALFLAAAMPCYAREDAPRERISFNADWRFHKGEPAEVKKSSPWIGYFDKKDGEVDYLAVKDFMLATGNDLTLSNPIARPATNPGGHLTFLQPGFDDKAWRKLNLPHDWAIEGPFDIKEVGHTGKLPFAGQAWYRKRFALPASDEGRRIFLEIDGAMAYSAVWVNGQLAGGWPYGYSSYQVDITPFVKCGGENVIAIHLDNPPKSSRWYPGAGIYRNVWLTKTSPVHIAHWGTYVTTLEVSAQEAVISLKGTVQNQDAIEAKTTVETSIYELDARDQKGSAPVATIAPAACTVLAGKTADFEGKVRVSNPKLWDTTNPQRYVAVTEVTREGKVVDRYETPFGICTRKFTVDDGFHLNGKRVQIKGVCMHHDLGALGTAVNVRALQRQLEILKEMGVNGLRTSHNMPAPELLELCDKMGILVMNESFDSWDRGKCHDWHFKAWRERDLRAFVRRDRNHPSVIIWSLGNEIKEQGTTEGIPIVSDLAGICHEEDPSRAVCMGANYWDKWDAAFTKHLDVMGMNYPVIVYERFSKAKPLVDMPLFGSETASTISSRGVYFFEPEPEVRKQIEQEIAAANEKLKAPIADEKLKKQLEEERKRSCKKLFESSRVGSFQVTSYDTYNTGWGNTPDGEFKALEKFPRAAGEFVWTGFDYLGEPFPYIEDMTVLLNFRNDPVKQAEMEKELKEFGKIKCPSRSSYFGIVDLAGFKKDRFYIYQAHWRPDFPMVHVLPHWNWPERVGKVTPVYVYSSGDEVELFLNGKSLGRLKRQPQEYRFKWMGVIYAPGELKAVAYKAGKPWAEETVKTTGAPAGITLDVDRPVISKDGRDLAFVTAKVVDANGLTVPVAMNTIKFSVTGGPGEIVATDNGDATDLTTFSSPERKAFNGLALAIVRFKAGEEKEIKLSATASNLKPVTCVIRGE